MRPPLLARGYARTPRIRDPAKESASRRAANRSPPASHTPIAATMTSPTLNHRGMPGDVSSYSDAIASTGLLDDLLGELAELLAQRVEVEAQRREHDAVDAVVRKATHA